MNAFSGRSRGPVFSEDGASILGGISKGLWTGLAIMFPALLPLSQPLSAQEAQWNSPRVLELVHLAREVRRGVVEDPTLRSYTSNARGYVYFYLDREDTGERVLVKTDQLALQVFWQAPDLIRQRIVGLRDEKSLPTNIRYHLDHLVVVQDEFGDRIRIGDGDEVEAVIHPMAPGSDAFYDFLLADSVTIHLPASSDTVRVYELQVRPKDLEIPGFIGSVFLDRDTGAIVRMSFTFTPSSYVDPYLDHIGISLENGLWLGRHWLPFRQELEIRREVPYLDIPAGSVIRGTFEVRDYELNVPLPPTLFLGPTVTALPEEARRSFPFEEDLHAQLEEEGLRGFQPPPEMDEIQSMAFSIVADRSLSGLRRSRLFLPPPTVSSALRFNRAEGLFLGAGYSHLPSPQLGLTLYGGFSVGRERPTLRLQMTGGERHPLAALELFQHKPRDLGPIPAISGVLNSLSSATLNEDFTDLYFTSGVSGGFTFSPSARSTLRLEARREEHRPARDVVSSKPDDTDFRPVIPTDRGTWTSVSATGSVQTGWPGLSVSAEGLLGHFQDQSFGFLSLALDYRKLWLTRGIELRSDLRGGALMGDGPRQASFFLGGRRTVPGYSFRSREGDQYWLFRSEASFALLAPWLRLRAFAAAGGVREAGSAQSASPSAWSQLLSAGLGLGLGWDVLRLDLARGLRDRGKWELLLSVNPDFWPWL